MPTFEAADFYNLDELLTADERRTRDPVRHWVQERYLPVVAQHYRDGTFPMELVPELAQLGVFGPSIKGYGCAGLGSVAAGLIMQELERGDSGLRTFASVQGSLAMMAINLFGSEEQKNFWLPAMAQGNEARLFCPHRARLRFESRRPALPRTQDCGRLPPQRSEEVDRQRHHRRRGGGVGQGRGRNLASIPRAPARYVDSWSKRACRVSRRR